MSEKFKIIDDDIPTFITLTIIDWVDLFIRQDYTDILDASLNYCTREKGLKVHAYVYMTSHIHLIVSSDKVKLSHIIRDFKKFTNKEFIKIIDSSIESRRHWLLRKFAFEARTTGRAKLYKIWQDGFYPIILDSLKKCKQKVDYIHKNPVKAGFVFNEEEWVNSSYSVYEEGIETIPNVEIFPLW